MPLGLDYDPSHLAEICRRYRVAKLELFGSRARGEARPDSDVDLLVTFEEGYTPGWELAGLLDELIQAFGRKIDLITRWTLEHDPNPDFRQRVEADAKAVYAA